MTSFTFNPETDEITIPDQSKTDKNYVTEEDKLLLELFDYFTKSSNYFDIPKRLMKALNYWIQAPEDVTEIYFELMKTQTIGLFMVQDIGEHRKLRRGKPTVNDFYGVPHTINAILYSISATIYIPSSDKIQKNRIDHIEDYSLKRHLLIELREKVVCPNEELYYKICGSRGVLMQFPEQILVWQQLYGTNEVDLTNFLNKIRIFLTIVDECRRLAVNNTDDIRAGYFSFPMMYVINKNEQDGQVILNAMAQRSGEEVVLNYALSIVKKSDCFEYAKKQLHLLKREIIEEYSKFNRNPLMNYFFNDYMDIPENFEDVTWELS